jgi:hypothetical protein
MDFIYKILEISCQHPLFALPALGLLTIIFVCQAITAVAETLPPIKKPTRGFPERRSNHE